MHVLWDVASYYWNHDIRFTPLFHCFGGINRSTAALCAWLVIWWDLSVEDAIDCVLQQRPSLRPWKRRAYVLYALRSLEHHKHAWRWEFETSWPKCRQKAVNSWPNWLEGPGSTTGSCSKSALVPTECAETPWGTGSTTESCSKSILFRLGARIYLITDKIVQTELYRHLFFVRLLDLNDILCLLWFDLKDQFRFQRHWVFWTGWAATSGTKWKWTPRNGIPGGRHVDATYSHQPRSYKYRRKAVNWLLQSVVTKLIRRTWVHDRKLSEVDPCSSWTCRDSTRHEIHDRELFEVDPVPTGCATISDNRQNNMSWTVGNLFCFSSVAFVWALVVLMPGWDVRFRTLRRLLLPGLAFELDRRWIKKNRPGLPFGLRSTVQQNIH